MPKLHFDVTVEIEALIRSKANQAGLPLPCYLENLVQHDLEQAKQWPPGYFAQVFGQWQGEPLTREQDTAGSRPAALL